MAQTRFKKIPFDLELAKKITNKEVKGRIVTRDGQQARIICFDLKNAETACEIVALVQNARDGENVYVYDNNGNFIIFSGGRLDLQIEVPTYYEDYSDFEPCKWQPCLVRDKDNEWWWLQVCAGGDEAGNIFFYSSDGELHTWEYILPLTDVTERLIGTTKSYEELIQELDAESTSTNKS